MKIGTFKGEYIPAAISLFQNNFKDLRAKVPEVPDEMGKSAKVRDLLEWLFSSCPGVVALEKDHLVGYMGWLIVDGFRNTDRKAAYCPEWGHAAVQGQETEVYRAMYRAAAAHWASQGCQVHALTLLAHQPVTRDVWFWNGFGLAVVDAIRTTQSLGVGVPAGFSIRKATSDDTSALSTLDGEHYQHYSAPPVSMVPPTPKSAGDFSIFISKPGNSIWIAADGKDPVGFIQFERDNEDSAIIVQSDDTIAITGAYLRTTYRGLGLATAILDAAFGNYASQGYVRCSVDFESFNPEASRFWMRYFDVVCLSVMRVPERLDN